MTSADLHNRELHGSRSGRRLDRPMSLMPLFQTSPPYLRPPLLRPPKDVLHCSMRDCLQRRDPPRSLPCPTDVAPGARRPTHAGMGRGSPLSACAMLSCRGGLSTPTS